MVLRVLKENLVRRWKKKCSLVFIYADLIVIYQMPSNLKEITVRKGIWELVPCQSLFMSHMSCANLDTVCKPTKPLLLEEKHDIAVILILISFQLISATGDNWIVLDVFVSFWFLFLPVHMIFKNLSFLLCSVVIILSILKKNKPQTKRNQPTNQNEFPCSRQFAVMYLAIHLVQNSGYVKNAGKYMHSGLSLCMRFKTCFYELSASSVYLHWNTMQ